MGGGDETSGRSMIVRAPAAAADQSIRGTQPLAMSKVISSLIREQPGRGRIDGDRIPASAAAESWRSPRRDSWVIMAIEESSAAKAAM